jgi:hypothetical protein
MNNKGSQLLFRRLYSWGYNLKFTAMKSKFLLLLLIMSTLFIISCQKDNTTTTPITSNEYVVFAWNNLGMHCLNPTYDELVILPPYNTVEAQVVKRGNPPQIITTGLTVEYSLVNNTYSFGKREYGGFWTNFTALFGGLQALLWQEQ